MMKPKRWLLLELILLLSAGCTTVRSMPLTPAVIRATLPVSVAPPGVSLTPAPALTSTPAPTLTPISTPTVLPGNQLPFSTTLQIPQPKGPALTVKVHGLVYVPEGYGRDPQRRWPLIVFLHGSGERGYDLVHLASTGLPYVLQTRTDLPFVAVTPQLPLGEDWNNQGGLIDALIDQLETQYALDPQRIYLTGFSLGGYGTWALGLREPHRFAALVPVAGGWVSGSDAVPSNICSLAQTPVWVFQGASDESVSPRQAEVLVKALQACGGNVRYTLLPHATHAASGLLPYQDSELYDWLLQQSLPAGTSTTSPSSTPEATTTSALPIIPATPEIVNTPLPGDGSLKPLGQHAYSLDLNIAGANGVTHTATISYLLYLPGAYEQDPQQPWPLVLFLHGSDVWGNNPEMLVASGLPRQLASTLDFPAIVLSPQVPEKVVWWGAELDLVRALLDHIQAVYAVDAKRVYLTGLSTGGFGAWAMAIRYPQRFAALAPVAGGWDSERDIVPRNICTIKDLPTWVFHGQQDDIVLPKKSEMMVKALEQCGSSVRFTLYPDADHRESFERAYDDPELYAWMFEQHLP